MRLWRAAAGQTWHQPQVLFAEEGVNTLLGPVFEDRHAGTVFIAFWKIPAAAQVDLEYFGVWARRGAASG